MPRVIYTARKHARVRTVPRDDKYSWNEPKAKCVMIGRPARSLANSRSPKPLFYHPKQSKKSYFIITPYVSVKDESTHFVYKYDIADNKYIKFVRYPKEFDVNWPMHFIDYNKEILYIFDSNIINKTATKLFWKLDLINASWTKIQIPMPHRRRFKSRDTSTSTCYYNNNNWMNIVYMVVDSYETSFFMDSFDFKKEQFETKKLVWPQRTLMKDGSYDFQPQGDWKHFGMKDVAKYQSSFFRSDSVALILAFDYILISVQSVCCETIVIWCLDLFNGRKKWHKSNKQLPSYMYGPHCQPLHRYCIGTNNGYLHFFHKYFYHTKISLFDVIPQGLKQDHVEAFRKLTFGLIRTQIEEKYELNVPHYLKTMILCYYTFFHTKINY